MAIKVLDIILRVFLSIFTLYLIQIQ